jgi:hypothetical protein
MTGAQFSTPETARVTRSGTSSSFTVVIVSDFAEAWNEYLNQVSRDMYNMYGRAVSSVTYLPDEHEVRLTITGPDSDNAADISYTERAQQINVQIL